jgi:hypothetical protein
MNTREKFAADYASKLINLKKSSNPFQRFMRYCFGVEKALNTHAALLTDRLKTKEGVCRTLGYVTKDLEAISTKFNWVTRKLLGFKSLIAGYKSITLDAKERRCDLVVQDRSIPKVPINVKSKTYAAVSKHLEAQRTFIKGIEVRQPNNMPQTMEIYGRENQIHATAKVSGNKPMIYENLRREHTENVRLLKQNQAALEKIKETKYIAHLYYEPSYSSEFGRYFFEAYELNPSYEHNREYASNAYDGCDTAKRYVEKWMDELTRFSPRVEIDQKTNKPQVNYPYKSSIFQDFLRENSYMRASVWADEADAKLLRGRQC